jgi:hypothetical protein
MGMFVPIFILRDVVSLVNKNLNDKEGDETKDIEIIERKKGEKPVDNRTKKLRSFLEGVWWAPAGFGCRARDE